MMKRMGGAGYKMSSHETPRANSGSGRHLFLFSLRPKYLPPKRRPQRLERRARLEWLGRKHHQYPLQSAEGAQLAPEAVSRLKLKWAFGFQGAKAVYGQPTVASGRVFLGVDTGSVYSIDASTGCMYWMYKAAAAVRSAVSVGPGRTPGEHLAYFGDLAGNAYALNAATGEQVWKTQVEIQPAARLTAAPQLYQNRL